MRSVNLQLNGSGIGSWTKDEVKELLHKIIPDMFKLAAARKLKIGTVAFSLADIEKLWEMDIPNGKRVVAVIQG